MLLRRTVYALLLVLAFASRLAATHNRAGEITYKRIAPFSAVVGGVTVDIYTYSITVILYTNDGFMIADRCNDTVYFGDNTKEVIWRINGPAGGCGCLGPPNKVVGCGEIINSDPNYIVKKNVYTTIHTYPGAGTYKIHTTDPNRNEGVHNMTKSIMQKFYVESLLIIDNFTGPNTSPLFSFPPIDKACINVCYEHNPGAFDIDGDSLSYEITTSRTDSGKTVPGYFYPETGAGGSYSINPVTGLLSWCTPQIQDEYNIAFIVKEWRKNTSGDYYLVGYVLRDMQVIVNSCPFNLPPQVEQPPPLCVEAGKFISKQLRVTDPNSGQTVSLSGGGGAFAGSIPLATITPTAGVVTASTGLSYTTVFNWQTSCNHVRLLPYYCTIKASDNGSTSENKLVSFTTFQIRVVPPAITGLTTTAVGTAIKISWDAAICNPSENKLAVYKIYRKNDCLPVTFDPCVNEMPASSQFTLVGTVSASITTFLDSNNQKGLVAGQSYGYIVVAEYTDGLRSFAGVPACGELKKDIPIFTNVDVDATSTSLGKILLKWLPPKTSVGNLDTIVFKGPYKYVLSGTSSSTEQTLLSETKNTINALSTSYTHSTLNTSAESFTYQLKFYSDTVLIGSASKPSSIFLSAVPSDRKITLSWLYTTPWVNDSFQVYKRHADSSQFRYIATVTTTTHVDSRSVVNGSTYCYYVKAYGAYSNPLLPQPLINRSQEICSTAKDDVPPIPPTASLTADCASNMVSLQWNDISAQSDDVASYQVYYKSNFTAAFVLLGNYSASAPFIYSSDNPKQIAGCYAVGATDKTGNVGVEGPEVCVDICPEFELPNVFSPNGDDANDHFKALRVKQINEINLAVLDRWGNVVFETKDPYFEWDGISQKTGIKCSDGVLVYVCTVFEPHITGTTQRRLSSTLQLVR